MKKESIFAIAFIIMMLLLGMMNFKFQKENNPPKRDTVKVIDNTSDFIIGMDSLGEPGWLPMPESHIMVKL